MNKYHNSKLVTKEGKWDSKREYYRYHVLLKAQKDGLISDLQRQVKYELVPASTEEYLVQLKTKVKTKTRVVEKAITYTCDFQYTKDSKLVVEDVKISPKLLPEEYVLKRKLMLALRGIRIKQVYDPYDPI